MVSAHNIGKTRPAGCMVTFPLYGFAITKLFVGKGRMNMKTNHAGHVKDYMTIFCFYVLGTKKS